jgi:integrase
MAKITKTFVDKVAAPASGYAMHWDDSVKGYGLRVSEQGKRVFIVMGRVAGKSIQFTLGPYGTLTEAKARERAQKVLQDMREGIDPRAVVKADAAMKVSLQDVLESYVGRPGKMKDSTAREYRRHVEVTFAKWAQLPIASITRDMVKERHAALVKGGLDGKRAAPASANAAFVTLRILVRFAMDEYRQADGKPLLTDNPVDALKHHWAKLGTRTERYIDKRKVGEVWNKLHQMRGEVQGYEALASVDLTIFALLTGARRDEMATLTWDRVHLNDHKPADCWWDITDRKRGEDLQMPLSSQAVALLKSRPRLKLADGTENPWVFPSWGKSGRIQDARAPMQAIGEIAGMHLSLHDLRRTFTNIAIRECRIGKFETDMLTGHKPSKEDVTATNYLDPRKLNDWLTDEIQMIGDWIEQQAAIAASNNVVQLQQRA